VQWLAVGEHAVEVEDDGIRPHPTGPLGIDDSFILSPARTGTSRRFSRGG
jgi:hypothetical protein